VLASYTGQATMVTETGAESVVMVHVQVRHQPQTLELNWWDGTVTSAEDLAAVVGQQVTLRLPSGRSAQVLVADRNGRLVAAGDPPF
jgi:hypothetical protein